jgi:hypothetical protein
MIRPPPPPPRSQKLNIFIEKRSLQNQIYLKMNNVHLGLEKSICHFLVAGQMPSSVCHFVPNALAFSIWFKLISFKSYTQTTFGPIWLSLSHCGVEGLLESFWTSFTASISSRFRIKVTRIGLWPVWSHLYYPASKGHLADGNC